MEQHSGEWSSAVSAAVWSLPQLYLENSVLHPLGLLISVFAPLLARVEFAQEPVGGTWLFCLAPLMASVEFPQEPVYGWSCSAEMLVLQIC